MMSKHVTMLLDVDGVLNASRAGWSRAPRSGYAYANNQAWKMRWEPEVMSRLAVLNRREDLKVYWATTWVGHTPQLEGLFKLPGFALAAPTTMDPSMKLAAALKVVRSNDKLIWVDDEAIPYRGEDYKELMSNDALLISPHPSRGLRLGHFEQIENYLDRVGSTK